MERRLRLLHLEDEPNDAELVAHTLAGDGLVCDIVRVATREEFVRALEEKAFDAILADYSLPTFDGLTAQSIASDRVPDVPFIFVSGTLGEEIAVERIKSGARDYVLKQRLARLPGALRSALRDAEERMKREQAEREVRRLYGQLEQRVLERTAQLAAANAKLADSEQRLRDILDHSPAVITLKDLDGRFVLVNRQFEALTGKTDAEVRGLRDHDVFPPRIADAFRENDRVVVETRAPREFEETVSDGGPPRIYACSKFPLYHTTGEAYAICGISSDITDRKIAEDALKVARLEADRANRAKSEFLSRMSHDLRTPLNAILGFAQLLELDAASAEQRDNVRQILKGGAHLLELINEVLDIARIEAGHLSLSPEPILISDVVGRALDLVKPLAAARGITLDGGPAVTCDDYVFADRQRLTQILLNLLSNAVKYNRAEGRVALSCENAAPGRFRIAVTDSGAGISAQKLALLFNPFERLGAEQTTIEGTGLGLVLSKGLAEAMGGTLGVSSELDRGSTFWVELAICDAPATKDARQPAVRTASAAAVEGKVLYIEDNLSNVRLIERIFARRPGVTLLGASAGSIGIELARDHQPDLVLLDLHLPDMHGEEVLRRLLADPRTRQIPVAVLSADATQPQIRRLLAAGATAYLTKPIEVARLIRLVDETLHAPDVSDVRPSTGSGRTESKATPAASIGSVYK